MRIKAGLMAALVALSGYGLGEDRERALAAGFDVHLTKPPQIPQLLKLIADAPGGESGSDPGFRVACPSG